MKYDGQIDIAVGASAASKTWKNKKVNWSDLAVRLTTKRETEETIKEFLSMNKQDQSKVKDVGGFVGGYVAGGRRKPENIKHRQLLTLDIDFADIHFWEYFTEKYNCAAVLHGTHKHTKASPRLRLVIPLNRAVARDEYVAISRKVAGEVGIDYFDNTTFQPERLMFWPSSPRDVSYYNESQEGDWLDADKVLDSYVDWKDSSAWPTADSSFQEIKDATKKQQDPSEKKGIIGAFCRTYDIHSVIEAHLSDCYTPASEGRYTYLHGSAAAGLTTYDDKFAYSHHGTDPAGGQLCNVFDLVRLHKFGHLDSEMAEGKSAKSFKAMEEFCVGDEATKATLANEKLTEAKYAFAEEINDKNGLLEEAEGYFWEDAPKKKKPAKKAKKPIDTKWAEGLEMNSKGEYPSTAPNINYIFQNDPALKDHFRFNAFDNRPYIFGDLPWRTVPTPEPMKNVDEAGIRNYFESIYKITGRQKLEDSLALEFDRNQFHPIRDYLKGLKWDGKERIAKLLPDYFGADNNIYTCEVMRKFLCAAVARVFFPGVKYDLVLTLVGRQEGKGKSTFARKLGKHWFSDSFNTVKGKEAFEQLQGAWIMEMAELSALRKAEVEAVKHFITKQEDAFRPAFGRRVEYYQRQCVFIGTTNNEEFLKGTEGNRRFAPIKTDPMRVRKSPLGDALDSEVDQIWAEAVMYYKKGEKLFLSDEAESIAKDERVKHSETDERTGVVHSFLEMETPSKWKEWSTIDRRNHLLHPEDFEGKCYRRDEVCIAEIWCECLGKDRNDMSSWNTRDINAIMQGMKGWERSSSTKTFPLYGRQKYYKRTKTTNEEW